MRLRGWAGFTHHIGWPGIDGRRVVETNLGRFNKNVFNFTQMFYWETKMDKWVDGNAVLHGLCILTRTFFYSAGKFLCKSISLQLGSSNGKCAKIFSIIFFVEIFWLSSLTADKSRPSFNAIVICYVCTFSVYWKRNHYLKMLQKKTVFFISACFLLDYQQ